MGKPQTKFEPVQMKAEPVWYVRITLPHGEQIHINGFTTEAEAWTWINGKSTAWLKLIFYTSNHQHIECKR